MSTHLFIYTFFATKKSTKSTRGNTCCQIFVTDKSLVHVEPLRKRSDLIRALKSFAKEIGVPEATIVDGALEDNSSEVKKFCDQVGTSLRMLEKGTPWSNLAEMHRSIQRFMLQRFTSL